MKKKIDNKTVRRGLLPYLILLVVMLGIYYVFTVFNQDLHELTYNEFIDKLEGGKITELQLVARGSGYVYDAKGSLSNYKEIEFPNETEFNNTSDSSCKIINYNETNKIIRYEI